MIDLLRSLTLLCRSRCDSHHTILLAVLHSLTVRIAALASFWRGSL